MTLMQRRRVLMGQAKAGGKSDMNSWTSGIAYTDLTIVKNSYYRSTDGSIASYNGWDRTSNYVPIHGASTLILPKSATTGKYNWFFGENGRHIPGSSFSFSTNGPATITVPSAAYYFGLSAPSADLAKAIQDGIIPMK